MILNFKSSYTSFWDWFIKNQDKIFEFEKNQDAVFDELTSRMEKVNKNLTFEFSSVREDGRRDFIISADGIKSAFPAVEALYSQVPKLEKWNVIKFRPRRTISDSLTLNNKTIYTKDISFLIVKDEVPNKLGILMFFVDYSESERDYFGQISFLLLDEALGEYDVETKVGVIASFSTESAYYKSALPLSQLSEDFDIIHKEHCSSR